MASLISESNVVCRDNPYHSLDDPEPDSMIQPQHSGEVEEPYLPLSPSRMGSPSKEENQKRVRGLKQNRMIQRLQKTQERRLKIVEDIKEKANFLRDLEDFYFQTDGNPQRFTERVESTAQDIFRATRQNERRYDRIRQWHKKKYRREVNGPPMFF